MKKVGQEINPAHLCLVESLAALAANDSGTPTDYSLILVIKMGRFHRETAFFYFISTNSYNVGRRL